jgi:hypothetical protein
MCSVLLLFSGHTEFIVFKLFPKLGIASQGKPCCLYVNWLFIKHDHKIYVITDCFKIPIFTDIKKSAMKTFEMEAMAAPLIKVVDTLQIFLWQQAEPASCWFTLQP